ncbi:MAG TPA: hypothetical protein VHV83_19060 [Armatimonadota bacterium]|nr:hypothetical protein [Armatimonadota bacterium]
MPTALPAVIILCVAGVGLIIAHFVLRRKRRYLLFLGISLILFSFAPLSKWDILRWVLMAASLAAIALALREAYEETLDRMARARVEQRQREEAFSEYVQELARKGFPKKPPEEP